MHVDAIPEPAMFCIHKWVTKLHAGENSGYLAFVDMKDREKAAIRNAKADPPLTKHQLLGFKTFFGFQAHVQEEKRLEDGKRLRELQSSMPEWQKFGFESRGAYKRHCRRLRGRE
tara:strand:- start:104 stop:448 length:345 start_codon:yes stop_codon:yes gene_type:complete